MVDLVVQVLLTEVMQPIDQVEAVVLVVIVEDLVVVVDLIKVVMEAHASVLILVC